MQYQPSHTIPQIGLSLSMHPCYHTHAFSRVFTPTDGATVSDDWPGGDDKRCRILVMLWGCFQASSAEQLLCMSCLLVPVPVHFDGHAYTHTHCALRPPVLGQVQPGLQLVTMAVEVNHTASEPGAAQHSTAPHSMATTQQGSA